jgi:hypothetical protein
MFAFVFLFDGLLKRYMRYRETRMKGLLEGSKVIVVDFGRWVREGREQGVHMGFLIAWD